MKLLHKTKLTLDLFYRQFIRSGVLKSIWTERAEVRGDPVPWISLPALHALNTMQIHGCRILEIGAGGSTTYWTDRTLVDSSIEFFSVEPEEGYRQMLNRQGIYVAPASFLYEYEVSKERPAFDIIIVDSSVTRRAQDIETAVRLLAPKGLIVLDDSNWFSTEAFLRLTQSGMSRIDFAGMSHCCSFTKLTSFYSTDLSKWTDKCVHRTPLGGLGAYPVS